MSQKSYNSLTAVIFLIIGAMHIIRAVSGWEVTLGDTEIPIYASWIAAIIALLLSWVGFKQK